MSLLSSSAQAAAVGVVAWPSEPTLPARHPVIQSEEWRRYLQVSLVPPGMKSKGKGSRLQLAEAWSAQEYPMEAQPCPFTRGSVFARQVFSTSLTRSHKKFLMVRGHLSQQTMAAIFCLCANTESWRGSSV